MLGTVLSPSALVLLLQFAYTVVVADHARLAGQPMGVRAAVAALAGVLALAEARWTALPPTSEARFRLAVARPFLFTTAALAAARLPRTTAAEADAVAFLLVVQVATAAGGRLWAALLAAGTWRRWVRRSVAAAAAAVCVWGVLAPMPWPRRPPASMDARAGTGWLQGKPNIVMIVLDTVGAGSLSAYGYSRSTSPRLEAFARRAVLYANCLAPSVWTVPSHASLFTGTYPFQHGADFATDATGCTLLRLDGGRQTLAEALSARGYATAAIIANEPFFAGGSGLERGFGHVDAGRSRTSQMGFRPLLRLLEGRLPPWALREWRERWLPQTWRSAEEIGRAAERWLERPRPPGQPYFLFLNYMDAHQPFRWHAGFSDRWPGRAGRLTLTGLPPGREGQPLTREEHQHVRALYDGSLAYLDHHLGRLLDHLERRPDWERTWVVVTADHGHAVAEGRVFEHGCSELTQQVLHVPLIVRYPEGKGPAPGSRVDGPVQLVDVAPTLLGALGLPAPTGGLRLGEQRGAVVAGGACPPSGRRRPCRTYDVVVEGSWKYVRPPDGPPRLFDLVADPREARDLAAHRPAEVAALQGSLDALKRALGGPTAAWRPQATPEAQRGLEALGYIR